MPAFKTTTYTFRVLCIISTFLFIILGCGSEDVKNKKDPIKIDINTSTINKLISTLSVAIKLNRKKVLFVLYDKKSIKAINFNMKNGLGTAGTIDEKIHDEIEKRKSSKGNLKIIRKRGNYVLLRWPSGKTFGLTLNKTKSGYRIDVINSSGGDILKVNSKVK